MLKLDEALELTKAVQKRKSQDMRIYQKSNEYLKFIFNNIDVLGKDVLTVLGSTDQFFAFVDKKAKKIDAFDINPLTEYYYFLRKWCFAKNICYPLEIKDVVIKEIIKKVEANSLEEMWAKEFWSEFYQNKDSNEYLFYKTKYEKEWDFPLESVVLDFRKLEKESKSNIKFYNIDIFKKNTFSCKYDVVFMSNILQRAQFDSEKLKICADNLDRVLHSGGVVLCTNFIDNYRIYEKISEFEQEMMGDGFSYEEKRGYNPIFYTEMPVYYTYKKK